MSCHAYVLADRVLALLVVAVLALALAYVLADRSLHVLVGALAHACVLADREVLVLVVDGLALAHAYVLADRCLVLIVRVLPCRRPLAVRTQPGVSPCVQVHLHGILQDRCS